LPPGDESTHFDIGKIYLTEGMKDKAKKEFETILKINPSYEDAAKELQLLNK